MPKSVLRYELDKVRFLDLETCSIPVCSPKIKDGHIELNVYLDRQLGMKLMFKI